MHADIKGALEYMEKHKGRKMHFEHRGKLMSNAETRKVLEYANAKGYKTTAQLSDEEVDKIISEK